MDPKAIDDMLKLGAAICITVGVASTLVGGAVLKGVRKTWISRKMVQTNLQRYQYCNKCQCFKLPPDEGIAKKI
jgi:multisubunit Na+/H+ antiporter MnhB subunit